MNSQDKEKMIKESKWEECDNCGKEYFNTEQETKEGFETWCKNCRNKLIEKTAQEKDREIERLTTLKQADKMLLDDIVKDLKVDADGVAILNEIDRLKNSRNELLSEIEKIAIKEFCEEHGDLEYKIPLKDWEELRRKYQNISSDKEIV